MIKRMTPLRQQHAQRRDESEGLIQKDMVLRLGQSHEGHGLVQHLEHIVGNLLVEEVRIIAIHDRHSARKAL